MSKICDNKSAGVLIWKQGSLLLIERKKYNPGFACPAGHFDGDPADVCARKEASEEVGLELGMIEEKLSIKLENPCKREGGTHHDWMIFNVLDWSGEIKESEDEVKSFIWADVEKLRALAKRTESFALEMGLSFSNVSHLVQAANASESWKKDPGLEPPWYVILKKMEILK